MSSCVKEDSPLAELVQMAIPLCQQAERMAWTDKGRRAGRRFLCFENPRKSKRERSEAVRPRDESHRRRLERRRYFQS